MKPFLHQLPLKVAVYGVLVIVSIIIVFHLLVIAAVIPSNMVWGGNFSNTRELITMEIVSVSINLLILFFVAAYAGLIRIAVNPTLAKVVCWVLFVLFLLNTLGNLLANNRLEVYIFAPITFLLAVFFLRLATAPAPADNSARRKPAD